LNFLRFFSRLPATGFWLPAAGFLINIIVMVGTVINLGAKLEIGGPSSLQVTSDQRPVAGSKRGCPQKMGSKIMGRERFTGKVGPLMFSMSSH